MFLFDNFPRKAPNKNITDKATTMESWVVKLIEDSPGVEKRALGARDLKNEESFNCYKHLEESLGFMHMRHW